MSLSDNEAVAKADNEKRRQSREENRKKAEEDVKKTREDQVKIANERMAKEAKLRPTPTPEELLMASHGHNSDQKEPDGSPEQNVHHPIAPAGTQIEVGRKVAEAKPLDQGYTTRAASAASKKD